MRRLRVDHDSHHKEIKENADQVQNNAVRRATEEIEKGEKMAREIRNLLKSGDTMKKNIQDPNEKVSSLNKIIKDLRTENEELNMKLQFASRGVPPMPRGSSRGSSPNTDSFEQKTGKIIEDRIHTALQKNQSLQAASSTAGPSILQNRAQQLPSVAAAEAALDKEMQEHALRRPCLSTIHGQCEEHEYHDDDMGYDDWYTHGRQPEAGPRQAAAPPSVTPQEVPRVRSTSPSVAFSDSSAQKRTTNELALARSQAELRQAQARLSPISRLDDVKDKNLVDIKQLRIMASIFLPTSTTNCRTWKMGMLHSMIAFDSTGSVRDYLSAAMNMRGEEQLKLKFMIHPVNQAMGILGSKFMHPPNFEHLHFGPLLETYAYECLGHNCSPTAPYIMSCIAS